MASKTSSSKKTVKVAKKKTAVKKRALGEKKPKKLVEISNFSPASHELVSTHEKLSDKDAKAIYEKYHATLKELPKISVYDPAIVGLGLREGDIIKITRPSPTAGTTVFYRGVVDE
ncbi:DNA-directed RNA polymerase subunit H [Candidatus Woesearchaeota archaeon]|nr:DNA-directed RNA polymerase subunit H [Candidatus Woesearchaeota archaeon]